MRRDVKIGIGVGLGVIAVAVLYFVLTPGATEDTTDTPDEDDRNVVHVDETDRHPDYQVFDRQPRQPEPDPPVDRTPTEPSDATPAEADTTPTDRQERLVTTYTPARLSPVGPDTTEPSLGIDRQTRTTVGVDRARGGFPRTYTVQEGDHGFWGVAQKEYGHGKYWYLIRDANPDADSNALRAGQVLRIPAIPAEDRTPTGRTESPPGSVGRTTDGRDTYTVQEGDRGFWGVSEKVYGTGRHADLIAEANPHVDSGSLRPGQTLVIPSRPADSRPGDASRSVDGGGQTYTVQEGDQGFWGVAQKVYGDGTLWTAIQQANPGVDSGTLRAGQTLVIPPKPESDRTRTATGDNGGSRQSASRRPRFD